MSSYSGLMKETLVHQSSDETLKSRCLYIYDIKERK